MPRFFRFPFAVSGDKTAIPDASQPDGSISYSQGFGPDYEAELGVDPNAKRIPRNETNELYYDITDNLRYWQINSYPLWVSPADNGGVPVLYPYAARVRYDPPGGGAVTLVYISLIVDNTAVPTDATAWRQEDAIGVEFASINQTKAGTRMDLAVTPFSLSGREALTNLSGLIFLATEAEVQAGSNDRKAVTPATLASLTAQIDTAGLIKIADAARVLDGTSNFTAVTPVSLRALTSTTERAGLVELATAGETQAGTDLERAVTPAGLASLIASTVLRGIVRLATNAQVLALSDSQVVVTPAGLDALAASTTQRGIVELATTAETQAGSRNDVAVTPFALLNTQAGETSYGVIKLATAAQTQAGTNDFNAVTPGGLRSLTANTGRAGLIQVATLDQIRDGTRDDVAVTPLYMRGAVGVGSAGSYAFLHHPTSQVVHGDVFAGSALRYSGVSQSSGAADMTEGDTPPPGTEWIALGDSTGSGNSKYATMFYRRT